MSPANMTVPRQKGREAWVTIATAVAGFVGLAVVASIHEGAALLLAMGLIGFAVVSLVAAILRKDRRRGGRRQMRLR